MHDLSNCLASKGIDCATRLWHVLLTGPCNVRGGQGCAVLPISMGLAENVKSWCARVSYELELC